MAAETKRQNLRTGTARRHSLDRKVSRSLLHLPPVLGDLPKTTPFENQMTKPFVMEP